jgi:hypothetical protein
MEDRSDPHRKNTNKPTNERKIQSAESAHAQASLAQSEPSLCVPNSHEPRSEPTSKPRKLAWSMTWYFPNLPVGAAASSKVPMFSRFGLGSDQVCWLASWVGYYYYYYYYKNLKNVDPPVITHGLLTCPWGIYLSIYLLLIYLFIYLPM